MYEFPDIINFAQAQLNRLQLLRLCMDETTKFIITYPIKHIVTKQKNTDDDAFYFNILFLYRMIHIIALKNCFYSEKALELLEKHKIEHRKTIVSQINKSDIKKMYSINTFPFIFENKEKLIIGGLIELERYIRHM